MEWLKVPEKGFLTADTATTAATSATAAAAAAAAAICKVRASAARSG